MGVGWGGYLYGLLGGRWAPNRSTEGLQAHFGPPSKGGGPFSQSFDQLCIKGS